MRTIWEFTDSNNIRRTTSCVFVLVFSKDRPWSSNTRRTTSHRRWKRFQTNVRWGDAGVDTHPARTMVGMFVFDANASDSATSKSIVKWQSDNDGPRLIDP